MKKVFAILGGYLSILIIVLAICGYAIGLKGTDFQNQYLQYFNYFSDLYENQHILFPHFILSFGLIQNAGEFIYYGLFNPVYIIQRLLGIDGLIFLSLQYIVVILLTYYLSYKLIKNHVKNDRYAIIGALFVCGNSYFINSLTYQIVFSTYLPILLIGMLSIYNQKRIPLLICMMLIFNFNFLMAIAVFFSYLLYGYYAERNLKEITIIFICASFLSLYIVLPVFYAILNSARYNASIPTLFPITVSLYGDFVLDFFSFSFFPIMAFFTLSTGNSRQKKLLLLLMFIIILPVASFINSLGSDIVHRFYVMLLPFVGILMANVFSNIKKVKYFNQKFIVVLVITYVFSMYSVIIPSIEIGVYSILYFMAIAVYYIALLLERNNFKKYSLYLVLIATLLNITAFTQISKYQGTYTGNNDKSEATKELTIENHDQFDGYSNEYDVNASQVSLYSSITNGNYIHFIYDFLDLPSAFFPDIGYIYSGGELTDAVFGINPSKPMVYGNTQMCNNSSKFTAEERTIRLLSDDFSTDGNVSCEPIKPDKEIKVDSLNLTKTKLNKLKESKQKLSSYIVYMRFTVPTDQGRIALSIDGQENKYTPSMKFYSRPVFVYYLDGSRDYAINTNEGFDKLSLSNIDIKLYKKTKLISQYNSSTKVYPTDIKVNQKDGKIAFSLKLNQDGWFISKIPYDPAYKVYVNGERVETKKINGSLLGANLAKGENNIVIEYDIPMLKIGIILSILFGMLIVVVIIIKKRKK